MSNKVSYVGLRVQDLAAAIRFYEAGLGLRLVERQRIAETGGEIACLEGASGGARLELNWYPPGSRHATPYIAGEALDHIGIAAGEDPAALAKRLEGVGGRFRQEGPIPGLVYVDSPDGHTIELWRA